MEVHQPIWRDVTEREKIGKGHSLAFRKELMNSAAGRELISSSRERFDRSPYNGLYNAI